VDGFGADPEVSQEGHSLAVRTELGADALLLTALEGVETMSRGFTYTLEVLTEAADDAVRSLMGKPITVWLQNQSEEHRRPLHGHLRRLTRLGGTQRGYRRWRAEMVPYLWFLSRNLDCRIYQDLSVPEILQSVFDEYGLTNATFRLMSDYPKLPFCVQYRESSFAFVSRLMEHAGIFYWHEHHADRHVLVLADSNHMAPFTQPKQAFLAARGDLGGIASLSHDFHIRAGAHALKDYDFEHPSMTLHARRPCRVAEPLMSRFEVFDYPGGYVASDHGESLAQLRVEADEAGYHTVSGTGSCAGFDVGKRFELSADRGGGGEKPGAYLLTEVRHSAAEPGYFASSPEPARYSNVFMCVPADMPFRPARLTEKPVVQGPQTATVVGPAGENIHTDEYGRVRLLFHWDRRGKRNEQASCWVRVSQQAAGSHWGGIAIPHVGQEVVVSFLEGDPDRPIVTGRVHNGANMPPLNLPRDKNKTVMRDHGDNKIIMHGQPGRQWLSAVSPRAVNLVAKRSAAKPLSADIVLNGVDFDGSQDKGGYSDLTTLWQELEGKAPLNQTLPDAVGKAFSVDPTGADAAYEADINLFGEGRINSMSGGNTNTWVGGTANTWINANLNQEVKGDTHTVSHGKVINVYKNPLWNEVEVMQTDLYPVHNEATGAHIEVTGVHVEGTILHIELVGKDIQIPDDDLGEKITALNSKIDLITTRLSACSDHIAVIDNSLNTFVTKTEIANDVSHLTAQMHKIIAGKFSLQAITTNITSLMFEVDALGVKVNSLNVQLG